MKWNVGPEYESVLLDKPGAALRALGFDRTNSWYGVAESQEVSHWVVSSPSGDLTIEAATYIGYEVLDSLGK